jgi:predicted O-linked N-acetylglucosamine transferase (SPINDLY family)
MNTKIQFMLQQAIQAFENGNFDGADLILKRILEADSKNFLSLYILGLIKASQSKFREAADYLVRAARIQPNDASLQYNLAKALADSGNDKDALAHHKKAVTLAPNNSEAWLSYGLSTFNLGRFDEALAHYDKSLSLKPDFSGAWSNKGIVLYKLKRYDEAITHYDKALSLKPDYAETWSNMGNTFKEIKRYEEAISYYDKALSLKPDYAEAWSNKGITLNELKRYDEALVHYDKALSLKPDYAETWSNMGNTFKEIKRYEEAISYYDKALSLKPDFDWVYGDLVHTKMKMCNWADFLDSLETISRKLMANQKVAHPFTLLALNDKAALHKKSSEIYAQDKYLFNSVLGSIPKQSEKQKIRVGYFSADFRNHAVSILTAELFELHDKNRFETIAFSSGADDKSPMRLRLSKTFNQFINVSGMSDLEIAKRSRELRVDIAVDLGGYTANNRTGVFAYRAAPIQISYIGYLGTMGAAYFDYLLADKTIVPETSRIYYSEKITYLPSYQANDRKRVISDRKFTKLELGLPENGFVFCCFNNNYKILPSTFEGWMRILKAVEGSVLFLYAENQWSESNLKKEAEARGINSSRLVFGGCIPNDEYLARYQACNLFLDTFPYNAGATASDALWTGLPVLTLMGQSFASRVAASLLSAIDLPELITSTQEEYEGLAIELALNPKKLAYIKCKLEANRLTAPLFDTPLFTKNIETAYIKMMERYHADLEPDHIAII